MEEEALSCSTSNGVVAFDDKPFERIAVLHRRAISISALDCGILIDVARCKMSADTSLPQGHTWHSFEIHIGYRKGMTALTSGASSIDIN